MRVNNETRVLNFLTRHFSEKYSINNLAKQLKLTPKGMHKLLLRLEQRGVVKPQKIANAIFYMINFSSDLACKSAELSLFEDVKIPYVRAQIKDLERLRSVVIAAVLFGSILDKGEKANDVDILVILEKNKYNAFQKELDKLQSLKTKRINPVLQTQDDLTRNIQKSDEVVLEIIRKGKVLWGHHIIVEAIAKAVKL